MSGLSTTIWLARHGEVHNPTNVLYGRMPGMRLSPEERRQAQALADYLAPRPLAAIYSSPMLRARRTAEVALAAHPELERVRIDADLQEVRTGWEGEPLASLEQIDWDFYAHPRHSEDESLHAIHQRTLRWLRRMLIRHGGSEVLGVSHGDPMLVLAGTLSRLPVDPRKIFPRPSILPGGPYRLRFGTSGSCPDCQVLVAHAGARSI